MRVVRKLCDHTATRSFWGFGACERTQCSSSRCHSDEICLRNVTFYQLYHTPLLNLESHSNSQTVQSLIFIDQDCAQGLGQIKYLHDLKVLSCSASTSIHSSYVGIFPSQWPHNIWTTLRNYNTPPQRLRRHTTLSILLETTSKRAGWGGVMYSCT